MIELDLPYQWIFLFLIVLVRVSLILVFFPVFGDGLYSSTIKILFAAAISLAVIPGIDASAVPIPDNMVVLMFLLLPEAGLAAAIGLSARLLLEGIRAAGRQTIGGGRGGAGGRERVL